MGRPSNEDREIAVLEKAQRDLIKRFDATEPSNLRIVELVFALKVAQEGLNFTQAYMEAWGITEEQILAGDYKEASINQQASRIAAKPRVRAEIERIQGKMRDEEINRSERLHIVLDGAAVRTRIAMELYTLATMAKNPKIQLSAIEKLGRLKHVDAWVGTTNVSDASRSVVDISAEPDELRAELKNLFLKASAKVAAGGSLLEVQAEKDEDIDS